MTNKAPSPLGICHLHMDGFLPEVGGGGGGMLLPVRYDSGESPWLSVEGVDLAQVPSVEASHSVLLCADAAAALLFGVYTDMGRWPPKRYEPALSKRRISSKTKRVR